MSSVDPNQGVPGRVEGEIKPAGTEIPSAPTPTKIVCECRAKAKESDPSRTFTFLSYEVGGWGALIALLVSLLTAGWTVYERFLSTPVPEIVGPTIINFACHNWDFDPHDVQFCPVDREFPGNVIIRAGPFVFLNNSLALNSYLISFSQVQVQFLSGSDVFREITLNWQYFSDATPTNIAHNSVSPVRVSGRDPNSKEIEYYPRRRVNSDGEVVFVDKYLFYDFLKDMLSGKFNEIAMKFTFTKYPDLEEFTTTCRVKVDDDMVRLASNPETVLYSRDCIR